MTEQNALQIRLATHADAASIAAVLHDSFIEYENLYTADGFAATTPTAEQIKSRMNEGPIWVVMSEDLVVGTVSVVPRGDSLYIRGMAVLPHARGQNVGESLLQHVEDFAHGQGLSRLFLSTTPFLSRAIRLYERAGFRRNDEGPHDLFGTPLVTMEKRLTHDDTTGL
jgi:N-acetylglutamate synthase-like GNAT family acetyltransferase